MEYVNKSSDSDLDPGEGECLWEQVSSVQQVQFIDALHQN